MDILYVSGFLCLSFVGFFHVAVVAICSFHFFVNSLRCDYSNIHFLVEGHVSYFWGLPITNTAARTALVLKHHFLAGTLPQGRCMSYFGR